jgi:hypothetical protein
MVTENHRFGLAESLLVLSSFSAAPLWKTLLFSSNQISGHSLIHGLACS